MNYILVVPYSLTREVRLDPNLKRTGRIISGDYAGIEGMVISYGSGSGYRVGHVKDDNLSVTMEDKDFYNMMRLDFAGVPGDSGSPVLSTAGDPSDNKYNIVGIYKGIYEGDGIVTHWSNIVDRMDVRLY